MRINYLFTIVLFCIGLFSTTSKAEISAEALNTISKFANDLCKDKDIVFTGSTSEVALSGNAKASLNKVLKQVLDLGVEGAAKYEKAEYKGLLQKDLADIVQRSDNCRLEVWRDLKDKLETSAKVSSYTVRAKTFPVIVGSVSGVSLDLYINDKFISNVTNFPTNKTYMIGKLKEGSHSFRFDNVKGYFVYPNGQVQQVVPHLNLDCGGSFSVTHSQDLQMRMIFDQFGNTDCDLK